MIYSHGCRAQHSETSVIDNEMLYWCFKTTSKKCTCFRTDTLKNSKQITMIYGLIDFKGSISWLEKCGKRLLISLKLVCGEDANVDRVVVNNWKAKILDIIANYAKFDIFYAYNTVVS